MNRFQEFLLFSRQVQIGSVMKLSMEFEGVSHTGDDQVSLCGSPTGLFHFSDPW